MGDFDGDGRDEIARTWPDSDNPFPGDDWPELDRDLQVLDWNNGLGITGEFAIL